MSEQLKRLMLTYNALSTRERIIIVFSLLIAISFSWWHFYATPLIAEIEQLEQGNARLATETEAAVLAGQAIQKRLADGVHKDKLARIEMSERELQRVNAQLDEKAYDLVEPERMFELMSQLVFADSRLKLSSLSRKGVEPVFAAIEGEPKAAENQQAIFRHTMALSLEGGFVDILHYVQAVEEAGWKLLWDSIRLKTGEYPKIVVDLEISTLSKSRQWVGL